MVIQTDLIALKALNQLRGISLGNKSSARLNSGLRINNAADDAAGLSISSKMFAQIRGLDRASQNAQDGISLLQTADGWLQEIQNMLHRIRELSVRAANDTFTQSGDLVGYTYGDRDLMEQEVKQLKEEINTIAAKAEFNKIHLFKGKLESIPINVVSIPGSGVSTPCSPPSNIIMDGTAGFYMDESLQSCFTNKTIMTINGINYQFNFDGQASISDGNIEVKVFEAVLGDSYEEALPNEKALFLGSALFDAVVNNDPKGLDMIVDIAYLDSSGVDFFSVLIMNLNSDDVTVSYSSLPSDLSSNLPTILTPVIPPNSPLTLYLQIGANSEQGTTIHLPVITHETLGINEVSVATRRQAEMSITLCSDAIDKVSEMRSYLGAMQNRLENTIRSLEVSSINLSDAKSRIMDADMAKEMINLLRSTILSEAATMVLVHANQNNRNTLVFLGHF